MGLALLKILRKTRYVSKKELLSMLRAETKVNALRAIVGKEFAPKLIKRLEEVPIMSNVYSEIDRYHAHILRGIVEESGYRSLVAAVDGVAQVYSLIVMLMAHQAGLKPVTYAPLADLEVYQEIIANESTDKRLNPIIRGMLARYYSHKHLRGDDVLRMLDELRLAMLREGSYKERAIAGLYFDGIMSRLCAFEEFSELHFRTILFEKRDFDSLRATLKTNVNAAIDVIRRAHPLLALFSDALKDCLSVTYGLEALDLASVIAPAYVSALTLHASEDGLQLKQYLLFLRQAILLKMILTHIEDAVVKDGLRMIIERWAVP